MTARILRYPLDIVDHQRILAGFPILSVAVSREEPNALIDMWAYTLDGDSSVPYDVFIVGTGNPIPASAAGAKFVGTVVTPNSRVWHVLVQDLSVPGGRLRP